MSAISASSARCKTMADGTLQLTINIEPRDAIKAFTLFSAPGTALAIAALVPEHARKAEQIEPAEAAVVYHGYMRGGEIARWLGIRCGEPEFQAWAGDRWPMAWQNAIGKTPAQRAGSVIRAACSVESRREFDNDPEAERRFHKLIREPWAEYQKSRGDA